MTQEASEFFQKIADAVLQRSAWGFLGPEDARTLFEYLTALEKRKIGFSFADPKDDVGETPGIRITVGFKSRSAKSNLNGAIWVESNHICYTQRPVDTNCNTSVACIHNMDPKLIETMDRSEGWIQVLMEVMMEQAIGVYGREAYLRKAPERTSQPA